MTLLKIKRKIQKSDSYYLNLPVNFIKLTHLEQHDEVALAYKEDILIIAKDSKVLNLFDGLL